MWQMALMFQIVVLMVLRQVVVLAVSMIIVTTLSAKQIVSILVCRIEGRLFRFVMVTIVGDKV